MKLRRLIQFRLRTAQIAMLALGVFLGILPYWFGPYDRMIDLVTYRVSKPRTKWAGTNWPGGNGRTREFLQWSGTLHFDFCGGELDSNGDFITLSLYPCWPTNDEQLERISRIKSIRSLSLTAERITDKGLVYLESMPALKEIHFVKTPNISDAAIARFRHTRPNVVADFCYPRR